MDVGQGQQQQQQQHHRHQDSQSQCRQRNIDEEDDSVRRGGRGEATAMAMQTVQGNQIDAGCVTAARVENTNNNNGSGSTAAAAPTTASSGAVVDCIPAILERYVLHGKIDRGTFSTVTLATRRDEQHLPMDRRHLYAIKLITQTSHPVRTEREVRCMQTMGGLCNVVRIVDGFQHKGSTGLVMKYIPHEPFHLYFAQLSPAEVQRYIKELLIALGHVHRHGVIHRDVKPSNFLHSRQNGGTYMLVDFGLAQETNTGELTLCPPAVGTQRVDKRKEVDGMADASVVPVPSAKRHKPPKGAVANGDPQRDQVVFRNPLHKQQKGNNSRTGSPLKVLHNTLKDLAEPPLPLVRQIKSTLIEIRNVLKNHASMVAMAASTQSPLAPGCSERENKDIAETPRAKLTAKVGTGLKQQQQQQQRQPSDLPSCECPGKPQVCTRCLVKREMHAPRAGTPGYRPPEVLLKHTDQTTAVDIWAAGVILMSLLSKCYPFFGNTDDMTSLGQIISVFGYERVRQAATSFDSRMVLAEEQQRMKALSLRRICQDLRAHYHERATSADATAGAPPSGGSSPPPGADDARNPGDCCENCTRPPERCLCQERPDERLKDGASPADDGMDGDCDEYGSAAYDLLERLLEVDPRKRITAAAALQHPYFEVQY